MQPREELVRKELVRQWLSKAETDLKAAEALLAQGPPLSYPSCFFSQQAAEKYLKGVLTWRQVEFPKTHLLGELLDLLAGVDASLADSLAAATGLDPYAVEARYPCDVPDPSATEAAAALKLAKQVRDAVLRALPSG